ncbi:MAG: hypothetical protein AABY22_24735 [Nanoarchaeota archaeon]
MKIIIELPEKEDKERTLSYFYEKCLDLLVLAEINKFKISIEGTDLKMERK